MRPTGVYFGSTAVNRIRKGSTIVWERVTGTAGPWVFNGTLDEDLLTVGTDEFLTVGEDIFLTTGGAPVVVPHVSAYALASGILTLDVEPFTEPAEQAIWSKDHVGFGVGGLLSVRLQEANLWVRLKSSSAEYIISSSNNPFALVSGSRRRTVTVSFGTGGFSVRINGVLVGSDAYTGGLTPSTQAIVLGAGNALSTAGTTNSLNIPFQGILHSWSLVAA